jgi:type VI secretion system protein ImpK
MRKEIADLVFPVLRKAIEIKEGLRSNPNAWQFSECQKSLLELVRKPIPDDLRSDVLGDQRSIDSSVSTARLGFLGIHYALACWLDEIFISDSPWRREWTENKVETTLFGILERATEFWRQEQRAQNRPTRDALEIYYLCVMLGFRGEMADRPSELTAWRESVESQITGKIYSSPPGPNITPNVRRLKGAAVMQKWFMIATVIGLLFIPLLIILVTKW